MCRFYIKKSHCKGGFLMIKNVLETEILLIQQILFLKREIVLSYDKGAIPKPYIIVAEP